MTCERERKRALGLSEWVQERRGNLRGKVRVLFFFLCIYPVGLLNTVRILNGIQTISETSERPK